MTTLIDLNIIKANIAANVPAVQQVILPELVQAANVDTSALITTVLSPVVSGRLSAYRLPEGVAYPAMTYEQVGLEYGEIDGYQITRTDGYMLSIQALKISDIISRADAAEETLIEYSLSGAAGGMHIVNKGTRWQPELKRYETGIELNVVHLSLPSQSVPVVFIYPLKMTAEESQSMNCVAQRNHFQFVVLLAAQLPVGGLSGLFPMREDILKQILGKKQTGTEDAVFVSGAPAGFFGSLALWRDVIDMPYLIHY
jgi:hypothetical protein